MSGPDSANPPGRLESIRLGLRRTREGLLGRFSALFDRNRGPSPDWYEDLETALIEADLGPRAAVRIVEAVRSDARDSAPPSWEAVRDAARRVLKQILVAGNGDDGGGDGDRPRVIVTVGVNGGGKTTTSAKIARRLREDGSTVMLCAADTFRAGAAEQLKIWAGRVGAEFAGHRPGADPSAVVFDAASAVMARGLDALVIDTAGRLHTQDPLMRELEKIIRVVAGRIEGAPHEVLLVLDATTGQNGVAQARQFLAAARVTGLVLTKLDGTARGGVAVPIVEELGIPLRYVGIGEGPEDLVVFDSEDFLEGLLPPAA
ncbi:MAG: signal recognition particle-docking protein FtsY [Acidobacteriota bacterium]